MEQYILKKIKNPRDTSFIQLLKSGTGYVNAFDNYIIHVKQIFDNRKLDFSFDKESLYKVYITSEICEKLKQWLVYDLKKVFGYIDTIKREETRHFEVVFRIILHWFNLINFNKSGEFINKIKYISHDILLNVFNRNNAIIRNKIKYKTFNSPPDTEEKFHINELIYELEAVKFELKTSKRTYDGIMNAYVSVISDYADLKTLHENTIKDCEEKNLHLQYHLEETQNLCENITELNDKLTCSVCLSGIACMLGKNCKHLSCCFMCSSKLDKCPICRNQTDFCRIYFN